MTVGPGDVSGVVLMKRRPWWLIQPSAGGLLNVAAPLSAAMVAYRPFGRGDIYEECARPLAG